MMKMDKVANSKNDEYYTPLYAIKPICKYVKMGSKVWFPFDTENSLFVEMLKMGGGAKSYQHILEMDKIFLN